MPFLTSSGIRLFQFESLGKNQIHAIFSRSGGVSPAPWATLNMGGTVGDDPNRVSKNRLLALKALGLDPKYVYDVWQVHGVNVVVAESPRSPETLHQQADVILTNKPGIILMMRFADCVPILLHDPSHNVIGIVHAGWKGAVLGIARIAVEAMQERFNSNPQDILAAIGPSIGPDHYEIGHDVSSLIRSAFGLASSRMLIERDGATFLDLWTANRLILEKAGVVQIELVGICTVCHTEDWYSHRAEHGRTGRFGAIIALDS